MRISSGIVAAFALRGRRMKQYYEDADTVL
jgi:hypothetical protein